MVLTRETLLTKLAEVYNIKFTRGTEVSRRMGLDAIPRLLELKPYMLRLFPKQNTKRMRSELTTGRHGITVLREILKLKEMKLLSKRKYYWDPKSKKQFAIYRYILI
jgi:hypothetical protein